MNLADFCPISYRSSINYSESIDSEVSTLLKLLNVGMKSSTTELCSVYTIDDIATH